MNNEVNSNGTNPNIQKDNQSKQKISSTIITGKLESQGRARNSSVGRRPYSKIGKELPKNTGKTNVDNQSKGVPHYDNNSLSQNRERNKNANSNSETAEILRNKKKSNILLQNLQKRNMMINVARRMSNAKKNNKEENSNMKDRISKIIKKRALIKNSLLGKFLGTSDKDEKEKKDDDENLSDGGIANFKIAYKVVVAMIIIGGPIFMAVVFVVCIVTSSHVFLIANEVGHADDVRDDEAENNINKIKDDEEELDKETEDDSSDSDDDKVSYVFDIFLDESKEKNIHYEFVKSNYRPTQEASLEDLKDFYPEIVNYTTDEYNKNDVYKFFKKMYNIYNYYKENYKVEIDTALIMSVLKMQSDDIGVVFKENTVDFDENDTSNFDIDKDWSSYKPTRNNSAHDIEILAQAMVKEGSSSTSDTKDGNYVKDVEFMTGGIGDIYYFNQLDYSEPYGSYGTISSHGCGPTSLSIVVSSLLKEVHDPVELTNYVCSIGGCTWEGTTWQAILDTPNHYGLESKVASSSQEVIAALGTGKSLVISIMGPGHFTQGGHFIVLTATNSNGKVTVADPASRDRSIDWDFNIVVEESNNFWIITNTKFNSSSNSNKS